MAEPKFIRITAHGQRWAGDYVVEGKTLRFRSAYGSESVELGRRRPETVARELLTKYVDAWWNRRPG